MKRLFIIFFTLLLLTSCGKKEKKDLSSGYEKYHSQFYETFDTVIDVTIYSKEPKEGEELLKFAEDRFVELNKLFDKYHNYEITNIKTINDNAGIKPVVVDGEIFKLLKFSKDSYEEISNKNNICLGPVVDLWAKFRDLYEAGDSKEEVIKKLGSELPTKEELEELRPLTDMNDLLLNEKDSSVFLKKRGMSLDVGSIAKGWSTEIVARELEEKGVKSAMISAGGNVRLIGKPVDGRENFKVGIQNPNLSSDQNIALILKVNDTSVVTSGDYQRFFEHGGKRYCHIIDPVTLSPSDKMKSATVIAKDSGECDWISTVAFLSDEDEIEELSKKTNSKIIWIDDNYEIHYGMGSSDLVEEAKSEK